MNTIEMSEESNREKKTTSANANKKQVATVTGASNSIGLGITRALLEHRHLWQSAPPA